MKKNLKRAMGIMGSCVLLAGSIGCNPSSGNGSLLPETFTVKPTSNNSPVELSGEVVNLTEGVTPSEVENVAISNISEAQLESLSKAYIDLANQTASYDVNGNMLLSPFSISTALGMTENGACGDTLSQMEKTANGGLSRGELNTIMYAMANEMNASEDVKWNVANSLWLKDDGAWKLKDRFLNDVVTYYHPALYKAPFNDNTVKDINNWVKSETHDMIPEILDYIPGDTVAYLINAVAFEAEWGVQYEDNDVLEGRLFTNADGSESKVTMLSSTEGRYITLEGAEGFVKPYKGGQYSFVALLPEEGVSTAEYLNKLDTNNADISKAVREAKYEDVNVLMPEFTMDYGIELSETYSAMGMDIPFKAGQADFTEMLEATSGEPYAVWIGRILHKTHIEVDRKGTKAAAATVVEMDAKCTAVEINDVHYVTLDRPFVYAIVDNETGLPLFLGCQNTMN